MITPERAQAIILCYGGCPVAWPEHERPALEVLLTQSAYLRELQKQALSVDEFMGFISPEPEIFDKQTALCAERILAELPRQRQFVANTQARHNRLPRWREKLESLAAKISPPRYWLAGMAIGLILLVNGPQPDHTDTAAEPFAAEDLALYLNDDHEDEAMDMLAFLEPQLLWDDDEGL